MQISAKDRQILRELAARQYELSQTARNKALWKDWMAHGSNKAGTRPLIRVELGTFTQDVIPPLMQCEGEDARRIEHEMRCATANFLYFEDDTLVPDHYPVRIDYSLLPFGIPVRVTRTSGVGHHFVSAITSFEDDADKLGKSVTSISPETTQARLTEMNELFGDLLPVRPAGFSIYCCPMQDIIHLIDMEDLYIAMHDEPEAFSDALNRLVDDYIALFEELEARGLLISGARDEHLCQGTYCFTNELEDSQPSAKLRGMWLFMDSQETSGISPRMYRELVFPAYKRLMDKMGLVSYGCCEAVHDLWDGCLDTVQNLRKVSVSPWCNEEMMGERLKGKNVVFLRKPTPNFLGVGSEFDKSAVREYFRKTGRAASGCRLEIAQRDVYTLNNTPDKVKKYVQIIRESLDESYHW